MPHHILHWQEDGQTRSARWAASPRHPLPTTIVVAGDELSAATALRLANHNQSVLWRGDYRNAHQLLAAMTRRLTRHPTHHAGTPADVFHRHRRTKARQAQLLNRVLVELSPDHTLDLPHAPDASTAYKQALDPAVWPHSPDTCHKCGCSSAPANNNPDSPTAPVAQGPLDNHSGAPQLCHVCQQVRATADNHLGLPQSPGGCRMCGCSHSPAGDDLGFPLAPLAPGRAHDQAGHHLGLLNTPDGSHACQPRPAPTGGHPRGLAADHPDLSHTPGGCHVCESGPCPAGGHSYGSAADHLGLSGTPDGSHASQPVPDPVTDHPCGSAADRLGLSGMPGGCHACQPCPAPAGGHPRGLAADRLGFSGMPGGCHACRLGLGPAGGYPRGLAAADHFGLSGMPGDSHVCRLGPGSAGGDSCGSAADRVGLSDMPGGCHVCQSGPSPAGGHPRGLAADHPDLPHTPGDSHASQPVPDPVIDHPRGTSHLILPLPELLGMLGAHRWRSRGVHVPALDATIHPHYGVFAPTRQDYIDLAAGMPWPRVDTAFDIGTGTGVLAVLLAQRGAAQVIATDVEYRAVVCARDNVRRLGLCGRVRVEHRDLFPCGRADLIVCNPPWLPAEPTSSLEAAVYDSGGDMLRRLVGGMPHHLNQGGEAWLILSDLAERLGLRDEPTGMFAAAGLVVAGRHDIRPRHRTRRRGDPLAEHRAAEIVSLWRLRVR